MSFKTAVVECVLGHNIDKKYKIQKKSKNSERCFHPRFATNGVTWQNISACIQTGNSLKKHMVHEVKTISV